MGSEDPLQSHMPQAGISTSSGDKALQATGITQYAVTLGEKKCPSAVPHTGLSRSRLALQVPLK